MLRCVIFVCTVSLLALWQPAWAGSPNHSQLEAAKRSFRMAELAAPKSPLRAEHYRKAETLALEALEYDTDSAKANCMLFAARGRSMLSGGRPSVTNFWRFSGLNNYLSKTLELNPNHANALAAKGGLLLDLPAFLGGDPQQARVLLERALQLYPTGVATRVALAKALLRQGQTEPARKHLRLAAHYACLVRRRTELLEADRLLREIDQGRI